MIDQLNIYGMTKLEVSIERIKQIEPRGGSWYLAFSGGKDSCVIKALCDMARCIFQNGVPCEWEEEFEKLQNELED